MNHFKNPKNYGAIENYDFCAKSSNSFCGDDIIIYGLVNKNKIVNIKFKGSGCLISQATASLLTEFCKNKTLNEVFTLKTNDILSLIGVNLGPVRQKCALLSLNAIIKGLNKYLKK